MNQTFLSSRLVSSRSVTCKVNLISVAGGGGDDDVDVVVVVDAGRKRGSRQIRFTVNHKTTSRSLRHRVFIDDY